MILFDVSSQPVTRMGVYMIVYSTLMKKFHTKQDYI